jgi:hypothetical protein
VGFNETRWLLDPRVGVAEARRDAELALPSIAPGQEKGEGHDKEKATPQG